MKKSLVSLIIASFFTQVIFAQDIAVNGATVAPTPALVNGTVTLNFNFINQSAIPVTVAAEPTRVTVNLQKMIPLTDGGGAVPVTGTFATFFTWAYDAQSATLIGTQNQTIPGSTFEDPSGGSITFQAIVTEASAQNAGATGHGINVNIVPGSNIVGNSTNNDAVSVYGYTDGVLPVAFGTVEAAFVGSQLRVDWQTLSEKNNKEFSIDASHNGTDFHQIATVATQATGGNSDAELKYSFSTSWKELAKLSGFSLFTASVLMLLMAMLYPVARKKIYLTTPMLAIVIGLALFSCRKKDSVDTSETPTLYIRIGQTDIDGTVKYSKIVTAVKK